MEAMSNVAQQMVAKRGYDAFGNVISSTGTWGSAFGYAGGFGYQEDATGLKLLGHRYYDSSTGRFLTRDSHLFGFSTTVIVAVAVLGRRPSLTKV